MGWGWQGRQAVARQGQLLGAAVVAGKAQAQVPPAIAAIHVPQRFSLAGHNTKQHFFSSQPKLSARALCMPA